MRRGNLQRADRAWLFVPCDEQEPRRLIGHLSYGAMLEQQLTIANALTALYIPQGLGVFGVINVSDVSLHGLRCDDLGYPGRAACTVGSHVIDSMELRRPWLCV